MRSVSGECNLWITKLERKWWFIFRKLCNPLYDDVCIIIEWNNIWTFLSFCAIFYFWWSFLIWLLIVCDEWMAYDIYDMKRYSLFFFCNFVFSEKVRNLINKKDGDVCKWFARMTFTWEQWDILTNTKKLWKIWNSLKIKT